MSRSGIRRFVEVGPGTVLLGLSRSIDSSLRGTKFGEPGDLNKVNVLLA
jgi:malonyl CoA-acyl carrier protein transacylase